MQSIQIIFILCGTVAFYLFVKNLLNIIFSMENYNIHRRRLKQLQFEKKDEADFAGLIDTATTPILKYLLPKFKLKNLDGFDEDLKLAGWDKYFTAEKYIAVSIILKAIGLLMFFIIKTSSNDTAGTYMAVAWLVIVGFLIDVLYKNSLKNKKEALLKEFPDFMRKVSGFISSGLTIELAFQSAMKYVGDEWKEIVLEFVLNSKTDGVSEALEKLKVAVPIFEIKEFVSLVKLSLDRTGDIKESFDAQIEKVVELQNEVLMMKISRREIMAIAIQAPLLLSVMTAFALPTVNSMLSLSSM